MSASTASPALTARLLALFEDVAGVSLAGVPPETAFLDMGLDSLTLTQAAGQAVIVANGQRRDAGPDRAGGIHNVSSFSLLLANSMKVAHRRDWKRSCG